MPHQSFRVAERLAPAAVAMLIALAGCVPSDPRAEVEFSYADFSSGHAPPGWLRLRYDDGSGPHELRSDAYALQNAALVFPGVETRTHGSLDVFAAIVNGVGDTIATGTVTLPLQPDWRWGVDLYVAPATETLPCGGCAGGTAFPVGADGRDSLRIVWGGTRLSGGPAY